MKENSVKYSQKHTTEKHITSTSKSLHETGRHIDKRFMVIVPKPVFLFGTVIAHCENATITLRESRERRQLSSVYVVMLTKS